MDRNFSVNLAEQPEGGYTLTSNELPALVTEGDSVDEAMENFKDAYSAALELYEELGRTMPAAAEKPPGRHPRFAAFSPEARIESDADVPVDNGQLRFEATLGEYELRLPARKLRAMGCEEHPRRGRGSHRIWRNPLTGGSAVVPDYGGRDLRVGTIRAVLRNLGVGWEEFLSG